ncbi:MAG: DUF3619 family protein [Burkholderiaceae bacterium]|nr:DUF3619 family protein [Burkholderiaceae bacterium]
MNTADHSALEIAADHYARKLATRLSSGAEDLPYDISERLRAARMQALAKRKVVAPVRHTAHALHHSGGSAVLGGGSKWGQWWNGLVSAVPLMALLVGLVVINLAQDENGANEVAEVDAALLTDDLPPAAYADPGFLQYLKTATQNH